MNNIMTHELWRFLRRCQRRIFSNYLDIDLYAVTIRGGRWMTSSQSRIITNFHQFPPIKLGTDTQNCAIIWNLDTSLCRERNDGWETKRKKRPNPTSCFQQLDKILAPLVIIVKSEKSNWKTNLSTFDHFILLNSHFLTTWRTTT